MLFRGSNAVGYSAYPDNVVEVFVKYAIEAGMDIFRIFDSLNYIDNLRFGMEVIRKAGGVVEGVMCYTGDLTKPDEQTVGLHSSLGAHQDLKYTVFSTAKIE